MSAPIPYLFLPGTAAEALTFYRSVFGGELTLHTYAEFGRADGPGDAIAHGVLTGPVAIRASDAGADEDAVHVVGAAFALLGAAEPAVLEEWFRALSAEGRVLDPLQRRAGGAHDGQVVDRYGIRWLIGYEVG